MALSLKEEAERQLLIKLIERKRAATDQPQLKVEDFHKIDQHISRGLERLKEDPKIVDNLLARRSLLNDAASDEDVQLRELKRCQNGVEGFVYWLTYYCWTYDPRHLQQKTLPFVPFEFQERAAHWIFRIRERNEEGLIEKARTMGATWMMVAYCVWCWLFEHEFSGLFCSRKESYVDEKGNANSIMEKARMLIRAFPSWMKPEGYQEAKHALMLRIMNPANGSVLLGEGGDEIGRGGRASVVVVDEAAFIPNPDAVEAALSETSEVKFWLSTPNNPGDWFANKRFSEYFVENGLVLSMRWIEDPRKNLWIAYDKGGQEVARGNGESKAPETYGARTILYVWYEATKKKFSDPARMAREVDIDYTASSENLVFPYPWILAAVNLDLSEGGGSTRRAGADLSGDGPDKDIWSFAVGSTLKQQIEIKRKNSTQKARAHLSAAESVRVERLAYDAGGGYGGSLKSEYDPETNGGKEWPFELMPVNFGGQVTSTRYGGKPARDQFQNYKAEMFWSMRERFRKSYELAMLRRGDPSGVAHDPAECISIPNDQELISQLSTCLFIETPGGKKGMEPKDKMKARGVKSPDKVDSLCVTFAPAPPVVMEPMRSVILTR